MAANGQLVFTDVDKVTFKGVGNTSNAVIDTTTGKIGVGVDSPDANLHVLGNCFVSTNFELGGTMTMGTVTVRAQHELSAITATGNTTPHTVEFQNAETSLVTTGNVEVGGELSLVRLVDVGANSRTRIGSGSGGGTTINETNQIAIGEDSGYYNQGQDAIAIGRQSGWSSQSSNTVAIGTFAGAANQSSNAVAVGYQSGNVNQSLDAVAIGYQAGQSSQGDRAVAIGNGAGRAGVWGQGQEAIAIGNESGSMSQSSKAVAVGTFAGKTDQGNSAIAIGYLAGETDQGDNSIILNATGVALDSTTASSFHVKPVRGGNYAASALAYTGDGEIVEETNMHFDTAGNVGIGTTSPETKLDIRGRLHQEDGRYTFDFETSRPHFIDTLTEFRYVAMMNDDAQYIIPNSGTILYEYTPSTDTTTTVITATTSDNTVGTLTITAGREYYTNDMNPIVFVGGNDGATSSSGNNFNGIHTIVPYIYNGYHFGMKNSRYENANFFIYAPYDDVNVNIYINKGIEDTPDHTINISKQTVTNWIKQTDGISADYNITFEAVGGRILMSKYGVASTKAGDHDILKPGSDLSYNFIRYHQAIYSHDLFDRTEYISDGFTQYSPSGVPVFTTSIGDSDGGDMITQCPMELVGDVYFSPHNLKGFGLLFMHPTQSITIEFLTSSGGSWQQYEVISSPSKKASIHYPVFISRGTIAVFITQESDKTPDNIAFTTTEMEYIAWRFTSNIGTFLVRLESRSGSSLEDEYTPFGWLDPSKSYKIHKTIRPTVPFFLKTFLNNGVNLNDPLQSDGVTAADQGSWYYRNVIPTSFTNSINPTYNTTDNYFKALTNPDDINTNDIEVPVPGLWRVTFNINMTSDMVAEVRNSIGVCISTSGYSENEHVSNGCIRNYEGHNESSVYLSTIVRMTHERRTINLMFKRITDDTTNQINISGNSFILLEKL
jgi:hypothetical protein